MPLTRYDSHLNIKVLIFIIFLLGYIYANA